MYVVSMHDELMEAIIEDDAQAVAHILANAAPEEIDLQFALRQAFAAGRWWLVELLSQGATQARESVAREVYRAMGHVALTTAIENNLWCFLKALVEEADEHTLMRAAAYVHEKYGDQILWQFMEHDYGRFFGPLSTYVSRKTQLNVMLYRFALSGATPQFEMILSNEDVDPGAHNQAALRAAAANDHHPIVAMILEDDRLERSSPDVQLLSAVNARSTPDVRATLAVIEDDNELARYALVMAARSRDASLMKELAGLESAHHP